MGSGIRNLVIVCFCLGMVVAVLLPAVQRAREAARTTQSRSNLKQIGLALHAYHDVHETFPPGAVTDAAGRMHHGWGTMILPYLDASPTYNFIDFNYPWDDPYNVPAFRSRYPVFLNPTIWETEDGDGFQVTHYSASSHVVGRNRSLSTDQVTDSLESTILGGEISAGFLAWGRPGNWRDPANGLKSAVDSFGVSWRDVALLLMVEGSVKAVPQTTSRQVLEALSSPNEDDVVPNEFH